MATLSQDGKRYGLTSALEGGGADPWPHIMLRLKGPSLHLCAQVRLFHWAHITKDSWCSPCPMLFMPVLPFVFVAPHVEPVVMHHGNSLYVLHATRIVGQNKNKVVLFPGPLMPCFESTNYHVRFCRG